MVSALSVRRDAATDHAPYEGSAVRERCAVATARREDPGRPGDEAWQRRSLRAVSRDGHPRPLLRGRRSECGRLDQLLAAARTGHSGVLVLRGEAGVGKTALLDYLVDSATDFRILRAGGAEFETDLTFAALHQLCAPLLDGLACLPDHQDGALATAFGLSGGDPPDRFLVGLASLGLLSDAAGQRPLLCVIDDVHWLDQASAQTLAFVARRLRAEPIALVFAMREPNETQELTGLPELVVGSLSDSQARAIFDSVIRGPIDERVRDRIVAETRGNPLALLEFPRGLTPGDLAGGVGIPDTMPMVSRRERSFVRQIQSLPRETQRLLLVAAAEPIGDVTLLWQAAERLGIPPDAADAAVAAGLMELGVRARFRHPLVRSAVCRAAPAAEVQSVHRALADVTDAKLDPDRKAWHRAQGALGPDETVARELERCAARLECRGGIAAAAAFLARATELTPDPAGRATRALAAARAKLAVGALDGAAELLGTAEIGPLDALSRARLERLRAELGFSKTRGSDATAALLDAGKRLERLDAERARDTYLDAFDAAIFAGRESSGGGVAGVAEVVRSAPAGPQPPRPTDLLLDALATRFAESYGAAAQPLRAAVKAVAATDDDGRNGRALWLAWRVAPDLWDDELWHELADRAVRHARDAGRLSVLPIALTYRAAVHVQAGEFEAASALIEDAHALSLRHRGDGAQTYGRDP